MFTLITFRFHKNSRIARFVWIFQSSWDTLSHAHLPQMAQDFGPSEPLEIALQSLKMIGYLHFHRQKKMKETQKYPWYGNTSQLKLQFQTIVGHCSNFSLLIWYIYSSVVDEILLTLGRRNMWNTREYFLTGRYCTARRTSLSIFISQI